MQFDPVCVCLLQSTVDTQAPAGETVMMDQDPPIDPSVESAPPGSGEPRLPNSTRTGQVTNTPQLGPATPAVTQEIVPVSFPTPRPFSYALMHTHLLTVALQSYLPPMHGVCALPTFFWSC